MKFFVLLQSIDVRYFGYIFAIFPFCAVLSKLIVYIIIENFNYFLSNVMTYAPCLGALPRQCGNFFRTSFEDN